MLSSILALAAHVSQRCCVVTLSYIVFLHQTTTAASVMLIVAGLSYIVFLHQTTTSIECAHSLLLLSYIVFLHQTTTTLCLSFAGRNCLISSFYIKPQHAADKIELGSIVLYRLSTSNHNYSFRRECRYYIVLYRLSTSNHNSRAR